MWQLLSLRVRTYTTTIDYQLRSAHTSSCFASLILLSFSEPVVRSLLPGFLLREQDRGADPIAQLRRLGCAARNRAVLAVPQGDGVGVAVA